MSQIHEMLGLDMTGLEVDRELGKEELVKEAIRLYDSVEAALKGLPEFCTAAIEKVLFDTTGYSDSYVSFDRNDISYEITTTGGEFMAITEDGKGYANSYTMRKRDSLRSYMQRYDGTVDPDEVVGLTAELGGLGARDGEWDYLSNSKGAVMAFEKLIGRLQYSREDLSAV